MQVIGDIFNTFFFGPVANLLVLIINGLNMIHVPWAFGLAIIILTIIIRLLIWPFMAKQLKSARKMSELKPHMDALKEKHKGDKQGLAAAQMALYKEHGVNPAGGCLPTLIQIPIIWGLYQTIMAFFNGQSGLEKINSVLYPIGGKLTEVPDLHFLGVNLAVKPSEFGQLGALLLLVPIITALLQFIQSKMMTAPAVKKYLSDSPKEKKEKESMEDSMQAMQSQMMYLMPLMIAYFAFSFPIGLALYWNVFTILGIIQQHRISGWGGLQNWFKLLKPRAA